MTFYEKYQILCRNVGKSTSAVANAIGLNNSSVTCWKRGSKPKAETIRKLSEYFGVAVDYLMGLTDDPHAPPFKDEPFHVKAERLKASRNPILNFDEHYRVSEVSVADGGKIIVTYESKDSGLNLLEFQKLLALIAAMGEKYNLTVNEIFELVSLTNKTMANVVQYLHATEGNRPCGESPAVPPVTDKKKEGV